MLNHLQILTSELFDGEDKGSSSTLIMSKCIGEQKVLISACKYLWKTMQVMLSCLGKGGWGLKRERELSNNGRIYILGENIH